MTSKDKLLKKIFGALEGVDIKQSKFVSKINNQKEIKPEDTMPFPSRNVHENKINYGKGLDYIYGTKPLSNQADYPEGLNPFASALQKIKPSAEKLSWLKSAVVRAKSPNELHKVVDEALAAGARLNACNDGEWSIAEYVVLGTHFHRLEKSDRKKLIRKLMLSGAEFHDTLLQNKLIGEIYNELQPEVQPQIDERLEELEKAGESAVQEGELIDIEIDNTTSYIEFSEDSKIEVAKVLGRNRELGSNILKIGNDAVEVKSEKGGIRNYIDMSDESSIILEFPTSIGKLNIILYHDVKKYDQVQVRVENKEMWAELQKRGEEIGKNCLFGGVKLKEVVERGNFTRCGIWNEKYAIKEISNDEVLSSKALYADRACDRHKFYKLCNEYDIKTKIPPINNAAEHPEIDYMSDRNAAIRLIKLYGEDGMKEWKKEVNYGKRSYIEGFFSRLKQIFGFSFRNKSEINREKELLIKCYLLNKFTDIGMAKFEIVT